MEATVQIVTVILLGVIIIVGVGITVVEKHQRKKNLQTNK